MITDIARSLEASGIRKLVVVNGHGGNYVLSNVVQEANLTEPRMTLFPTPAEWTRAREHAGLATNSHDDMHAGEIETSILLHAEPDLVRPGYETADHAAPDRPFLLSHGMRAYTHTGVIGYPSHATAAKGKAVLTSLTHDLTDDDRQHTVALLAARRSRPRCTRCARPLRCRRSGSGVRRPLR